MGAKNGINIFKLLNDKKCETNILLSDKLTFKNKKHKMLPPPHENSTVNTVPKSSALRIH